jgi:hypothetical protein
LSRVEPHGFVCSNLYGFVAHPCLFSMKTWRASPPISISTVVEEEEVP